MHSYAELRWSSSDTSVAAVDAFSGLITAQGKGSARITADAPDLRGAPLSLTVTVSVPIASLAIHDKFDPNNTGQPMFIGQSRILDVVPDPDWDVTSDTVAWGSSDPSVAAVDRKTGEVTTYRPGNVVITVKATSGVKTSRKILVARPAESIELSDTDLSLEVGRTRKLTPVMLPTNHTDVLTWISENPEVATVSSSGVVTAEADGVTDIVAVTFAGLSVRCTVTVYSWAVWPNADPVP